MHRLYEKEDLSVFWDSDKCFHSRKCVTGCPEVFNFQRRPWIDLSRGEMAAIWQTVSACPSGALTCCYNHGVSIAFDEARRRSVALDGEKEIGYCLYREMPQGWSIDSTRVDAAYGGKGIAKRLAYKVLEEAEKRGQAVIPVCSYVAKLLRPSEES